MKVVCIGHSTFDTTLPLQEFPKENYKYRINKHIECGGGPASNAAYLLAKWGMDTSIVSIVGDDYYGDRVMLDFRKVGADITYLERLDNYQTSSSYIIANTETGSRTVITSKSEAIRKLSKPVKIKADVILVDGEHPETANEVLMDNPEALSILDAGRLTDDTRFLGKKVHYLVCSKKFAEEFTNRKIDVENMNKLISIHKELVEHFKNNVIITLEENGSFTIIDDQYMIIPTAKVSVLDSTGAGDIFHGAFTYFMANDYSLYDSIKYASITAAISVTRIGSRNSIPELSEVMDFDTII